MIKNLLNFKTVSVLLLVFSFLVNQQLYSQNATLKKQVNSFKEDPAIKAKEEVKDLVKKLSALVVLPEGEEPVVATVTDKDKLKDQPIFANAENGDKLIIYSAAKKAYLYDEKNNKVKDIIPVNLGDQADQVAGAQTENLKLALVNGTETPGIGTTMENRLKELKVAGVTVSIKSLAKKKDYQKTLVIDVNGKYKNQATQLAKTLSAELAGLPEGEDKPNSDLMVLIGADFK